MTLLIHSAMIFFGTLLAAGLLALADPPSGSSPRVAQRAAASPAVLLAAQPPATTQR